jgi:hypothetical protein
MKEQLLKMIKNFMNNAQTNEEFADDLVELLTGESKLKYGERITAPMVQRVIDDYNVAYSQAQGSEFDRGFTLGCRKTLNHLEIKIRGINE